MRRLTVILLALLALVWWARAHAQEGDTTSVAPVILTDEQDEYPLGLHLEILEDTDGDLTIEDVASPEFDSRFVPSRAETPNFGFTDSAYWVRLRLRNQDPSNVRWLLKVEFANMQFVDLYTPSLSGDGYVVKQTGSQRHVTTRDIRYPDVVFELTLPTQSQQTYYLRLKNDASMTLPLIIRSPSAFLAHIQQELLQYGLFFGLLLGLFGYNLFLLLSLREKSYLFLTLFIANMMFFEATYSGYLETFAFPGLYYLKPSYLPLSFSLIFISALLFSHSFLEIKTWGLRLHRVMIGVLAVWGVLIILIPFTRYLTLAVLMVPLGIISLVTILAAGIISWRLNFYPARFFLVAWLGLAATLIIVLLVRLGIVPSTPFTESSYHLGVMWMAVCWSIALADRINLLKAETEKANVKIRSNEQRLYQILEGLPLGVVVYGRDYRPSFANRRVDKILGNPDRGIEPDLSAGRTLSEAMKYFSFRVADSDEEYPIENMPVYRALRGEPASADNIEADLIDRRVPLEIWANPVRDDKGLVESAVVAFQDITERRRMETELADYRTNLERLVEERTTELELANMRLSREIIERESLEKLLYQHLEWLTILNEMRHAISGTADLPLAYENLLASILQLLNAKVVFIVRWGGPGESIEAHGHIQQGDSVRELEGIAPIFENNASLRKKIELGQPIYFSGEQAASLAAPLGSCFQEDDGQTLLLAPILAQQSVTGVFGVALPQSRQDFTRGQDELVETISLDLGELVEDAQLLDQAQALIANEERNRLARDLHDSVTQVLFSASLVAEVLPRIWRRDPERALGSLEELRRLTRGALAEMRTLLLELRPTSVIKTPLPELLSQLTEAITARIELPFNLYIEQTPPLPEEVQISFYRIAQEALNNVVKHAQASQVTVSLSAKPVSPVSAGSASWEEESEGLKLKWATATTMGSVTGVGQEVKLVIEDDGVGFSRGSRQQEHLGFSIMRERAAAVQANLSINSRPGAGTEVTLTWHNQIQDSS